MFKLLNSSYRQSPTLAIRDQLKYWIRLETCRARTQLKVLKVMRNIGRRILMWVNYKIAECKSPI